ncbi:hypothetical protein HPB48_014683 [Haemaphysalis longicornis]|uniref:Uncharacterized protein n=1 Tax=Haemaphysalis longicornis TaxID=44386 RepID=A0A9J6GHY9_HAELO|nr:hypothetical protein HPB48_014683 [Haemaphysalis longicornis]
MTKIIDQFPGDMRDLLTPLRIRYLHTHPTAPPPSYSGAPNPALDKDIQLHAGTTAIQTLRRYTALGMDHISNGMLVNLDDLSHLELTNYFKNIWKAGTTPEEWKTAEV